MNLVINDGRADGAGTRRGPLAAVCSTMVRLPPARPGSGHRRGSTSSYGGRLRAGMDGCTVFELFYDPVVGPRSGWRWCTASCAITV
jgi:hypothetical protein